MCQIGTFLCVIYMDKVKVIYINHVDYIKIHVYFMWIWYKKYPQNIYKSL